MTKKHYCLIVVMTFNLACSPYRTINNPIPPLDISEHFSSKSVGEAGQSQEKQWWITFNDSVLTQFVTTALSSNFNIQAAWARIHQAKSLLAQVGAARWPQISLSGRGVHSHRAFEPETQGISKEQADLFGFADSITTNTFMGSIGVRYEVDLWKRASSQTKAAMLDKQALHDDLMTMSMSIAAEVCEVWFDIIGQHALIRLLEKQIQTDRHFVDLINIRVHQGLVGSLDLYQAKQQLVATQAQLILAQTAAQNARHRLALVLGQMNTEIPITDEDMILPTLPKRPLVGVPADLLLNRPDVRASRRRAEAADYRVAAAVAARLPSISLEGSIGTQLAFAENLLMTPFWNIASSLLAPIFQGGRLAGIQDQQEAIHQERMADFGNTLLRAVVEVEMALVAEKQNGLYLQALTQRLDLVRHSLHEARTRYNQGLGDFLAVLTSLNTLHRVEQSIISVQRQILSSRIQLHRALGGTLNDGKSPS